MANGNWYSGITGATGGFIPQTPRQESETILRQQVRGAEGVIKSREEEEAARKRREFDATPVAPTQGQAELFAQAGTVPAPAPAPLPAQAPQAVPPLYPTPEMGTLAGQGVTAPQVTPQFTPQGPTSLTGAPPMPTTGPTAPSRDALGMASMPVSDELQAQRDRDARLIPSSVLDTFTEEEKRRMDQELKIAGAKQGIAGRTIIKSLQKQGMTDEEIKSAIGADQNPNMSKSQAVTKLKELQNKKRMQGASTKIAKQSERIEKEAEYNEDGSPANTEAKWSNIEAELATTGDDPLGEPLSSFLSEADKRLINNTRGKVASGASTGGGMKRVNKILMDAKKKAGRVMLKRQATEAREAANNATKRIELAEKNYQQGIKEFNAREAAKVKAAEKASKEKGEIRETEIERQNRLDQEKKAETQRKAELEAEKAEIERQKDQVSLQIKELDAIAKQIKAYNDADKPEEMYSDKQYQELLERQGQILYGLKTANTGEAPPAPTAQVQEVERATADGKIAIFDSNTKKFLRYK